MKQLPRVAVWRNAIRDSGADSCTKLTALTLSTYMSANGDAFPAIETIAEGASLSPRTVGKRITVLETSGYLHVRRSRGHGSHRYQATLPGTPKQVHGSQPNPALLAFNLASAAANVDPGSDESDESDESAIHGGIRERIEDSPDLCPECLTGGGRHVHDCSRAVSWPSPSTGGEDGE